MSKGRSPFSEHVIAARKGGLRGRVQGPCPRPKLNLSHAQIGLVERVASEPDSNARVNVIAAMEMGSGKTLAALATLCAIRGVDKSRRVRALFVVPKSTLYDAWHKQRKLFTRLTGKDVQIVTYARIQRALLAGWKQSKKGTWVRGSGDPLLETKRDLVVFDESHVLRNPDTLLAKAASTASGNSRRVICLTGTPIQNGPADASGQLRAMMTGSSFEDSATFGSDSMLSSESVKLFASRFVFSATMADAGVTLPPKVSHLVWVPHGLSANLVQVYNECLEALQQGCSYGSNTGVLLKRNNIMIMRQLCVEPALYHKHGRATFDKEARRLTVEAPGAKLREALNLVRALVFRGHQKVIVVSEFVTLLDTFKDLVKARLGEECHAFDGRLSAKDRARVIDDFLAGEGRIMCLSLGAGAYGLNLAPGPTAMIVLDVWFNPQVHRQVESRIHRIGQNKPVEVHTLVTRNSMEAAILDTHTEKQACAGAFLNVGETDDVPFAHVRRLADKCEPF